MKFSLIQTLFLSLLFLCDNSLYGMKSAVPLKEQLRLACFEGKRNQVQHLLESKVNPNVAFVFETPQDQRLYNGTTCLHWAALGGHVPVVKLLLEHKAHLNELSDSGHTPLLLAFRSTSSNKVAVISFLLEQGAALTNIDQGFKSRLLGKSPLEIPLRCLNMRLVARVINMGGLWYYKKRDVIGGVIHTTQNPLHILSKRLYSNDSNAETFSPQETDVRAIKLVALLKKDLEWLDQRDADGNTPLHLAALSNNRRFIASLLAPHTPSPERQEQGRMRMKTFLLVNLRLGKIFPRDIVQYILGFMRVDFKDTPRERLFAIRYKDKDILMLDYFDDCFEELPSLLNPEQSAHQAKIVSIKNNQQTTAVDLATDPKIKQVLDPVTWQQNIQQTLNI